MTGTDRTTAVVATGYTRFSQRNDSSLECFKCERDAHGRCWNFSSAAFSHESMAVEKREYESSVKIHEIKK